MKRFTLNTTHGQTYLQDVKRDSYHGKYAGIPNEFIFGKIDLKEFFEPEMIEKIENAGVGSEINLTYDTYYHPMRLYLVCDDPVAIAERNIASNSDSMNRYKEFAKNWKKSLNKYKRLEAKLLLKNKEAEPQ